MALLSRRALVATIGLLPLAAKADAPDVYVAEGDSITTMDGKAAKWPTYPALYQAMRPNVRMFDIAQSSQDSSSWRSRKPESYKGGGRNFMSLLPGNDIAWKYVNANGTRDSYLGILRSYLDARRAAGMKVVLCATLPRTDARFNAERAICNAEMATWVGAHCDYFCDFSADPMGKDGAAWDKKYYYDGVHPTEFGQKRLVEIIAPILDKVS